MFARLSFLSAYYTLTVATALWDLDQGYGSYWGTWQWKLIPRHRSPIHLTNILLPSARCAVWSSRLGLEPRLKKSVRRLTE